MIVRALAGLLVATALVCCSVPVGARADASFDARDGIASQWWRCTGHLAARDGRRFDFTFSIFRYDGFSRDLGRVRAPVSRWADGTVYAATLGIVDEDRGTFERAERHERGALGIAAAARDRMNIRIADWRLRADGSEENARIALHASTERDQLDLRLIPTKPAFAFPDGEVDRPSLRVRGTLAQNGRDLTVTGDAWLSLTLGTEDVTADALGWDRFTIELDDGRAMLVESERRRDGSRRIGRAVLFDARGHIGPLPLPDSNSHGGVVEKARAGWRSLETGARYPNIWGLNLPALDMALSLEPVVAGQEIVTPSGLPFWNGAVEIFDVRPWSMGSRLGRGFAELSGYTRPVELESPASRAAPEHAKMVSDRLAPKRRP